LEQPLSKRLAETFDQTFWQKFEGKRSFPCGSVAQLFSGEFLLAVVVFMIAFSLTFILWSNSQVNVLSSEGIYEMEDIGNNVVEQLIRTKGIPENWTHENVKSIGLANQARILNPNKTIAFIYLMNSSNYEYNKYLLGIGSYNFYLNLTDVNGTTIRINNVTLSTGMYPSNETRKLSIVRTSILDNSTVRIAFIIWL